MLQICQKYFANSKFRSLGKHRKTESAWISFPSLIRQTSVVLDAQNDVVQRGGNSTETADGIFRTSVFLLSTVFFARYYRRCVVALYLVYLYTSAFGHKLLHIVGRNFYLMQLNAVNKILFALAVWLHRCCDQYCGDFQELQLNFVQWD